MKLRFAILANLWRDIKLCRAYRHKLIQIHSYLGPKGMVHSFNPDSPQNRIYPDALNHIYFTAPLLYKLLHKKLNLI